MRLAGGTSPSTRSPGNPSTDQYLDPFGGRDDLARQELRIVDPDTFGDDSLRVLRALQFAARFELRVDEATKALCRGVELDDLPAERIWGEVEKLLLQAPRPSLGFELALELGVVDRALSGAGHPGRLSPGT